MLINRTIVLNPIEPEFVAWRVSSGIDTKVDFYFKGQNGAPHNEDVVGQLQLTSRSRDETEYISIPATDVVNGKARATIPGTMAYDPNGWRIRLTGTVDQEPRVIAYGVMTALAGAGPQVQPQDVIDTIPLTFEYNSPVELDVSVWRDTGKSSEYDLTVEGTTVRAAVYVAQGGSVLLPFTVTVVDANTVRLTLTAEEVNTLPASCWWNLVASTSTGTTTLAEGPVAVTGIVIPPLTETTAAYEYLKPDDLNPIGGQIIHGNFTRDLLKVAKTTQLAIDLSATLELVMEGDEIIIGATTWTVTEATEDVGWYAFRITPLTQDAVTGVTTVTFRRP